MNNVRQKVMLFRVGILLLGLILNGVIVMAHAKPGEAGKIKLRIHTSSEIFKVGDHIDITLIIENQSVNVLPLVERAAEIDFLVSVKRDDGRSVELTEYGQSVEKKREEQSWYRRVVFELLAGESIEYHISLSELFRTDEIGKYNVTAVRTISQGDGIPLKLESNLLVIVVD